jgi:hypothetical protein
VKNRGNDCSLLLQTHLDREKVFFEEDMKRRRRKGNK